MISEKQIIEAFKKIDELEIIIESIIENKCIDCGMTTPNIPKRYNFYLCDDCKKEKIVRGID